MDFTLRTYKLLLDTLIEAKYDFQTLSDFLTKPQKRSVILRHDVDLRPSFSLRFAEMQAKRNIKGVYYFRTVPESWNEEIILKIHALGHEIGYHYECLTLQKGNHAKAIQQFEKDLNQFRNIVPVKTICMHGSPMSKYDSKDLWISHNYKDFGVIGEPYFDIDFNKVYYLTDTGRTWKNKKISVRDRVNTKYDFNIQSSHQIVNALKDGILPDQLMFNFHPQRWTDNPFVWTKEFVLQNIKNQVKRIIVKPYSFIN